MPQGFAGPTGMDPVQRETILSHLRPDPIHDGCVVVNVEALPPCCLLEEKRDFREECMELTEHVEYTPTI